MASRAEDAVIDPLRARLLALIAAWRVEPDRISAYDDCANDVEAALRAAPEGKNEYRMSLEDCYMLARRLIVRLSKVPSDQIDRRDELVQWEHIVRFCEHAGLRSNVMRALEAARPATPEETP